MMESLDPEDGKTILQKSLQTFGLAKLSGYLYKRREECVNSEGESAAFVISLSLGFRCLE